MGDAKNICLKHHTVKSQLKPRFARLQQTITFRLANFFVQKTLWPNWRKVFLIKRDAEKVAFRSPCISIQAIIMVFRNVQLSYDNLPAIFGEKSKFKHAFPSNHDSLKDRVRISAFAHLTTTKIVYRSRVVPMIVPKHWTVEPENGIVEGKRHCSPPGRWRKYGFINLIIRAIVSATTGFQWGKTF